MELLHAIFERRSVSQFDPSGKVGRKDLERMIEAASFAPSSFNLQHWHFLVVEDPELKKRLKQISYDQQKIVDAAAAVVILGDMKAHEREPVIIEDLLTKGYIEESDRETAETIISGYYSSEENQRIEAIRGASLAAMNFMLAALELGYGTCPMAGFDPDALRVELNIPERYVPVLIIAVGPAPKDKRPRKMRFSTREITTYNKFE